MESKFIKSHRCCVWKNLMLYRLKLILNSDQELNFFRQRQILTGLLVTKTLKKRTMIISLFNYSMLGYILPITTSLPISKEEILAQPIFLNPHTRLDFKHHPILQGIFQTNLPLLGTFADLYNQA